MSEAGCHGSPPRRHDKERELREGIPAPLTSGREWIIRWFEKTSTTMDEAREVLPLITETKRGIVVADRQTAGRGSHGRRWNAAEGAFAGTFVFPSPIDLVNAGAFSLVIGCSLRQFLKRLECQSCLKWPNDLLNREGKKLAGVLVETVARKNLKYYLVGIGLNLEDFPKDVESASSVVQSGGRKATLLETALWLAQDLEQRWNRFLASGFEPFYDEWNEGAAYKNQDIVVEVSGSMVTARCLGVDKSGMLRIQIGEQLSSLVSGRILGIAK